MQTFNKTKKIALYTEKKKRIINADFVKMHTKKMDKHILKHWKHSKQ